jgi:hypothetical protein
VFDSFVVSSFPWETLKLYHQKKKTAIEALLSYLAFSSPITFLSVYAFSRPIALQGIERLQATNIEKV